MMTMQEAKNNPMKYYSGIFDKYLNEPNIEHWEDFPKTMWRLGYEMDCGNSYNAFLPKCGLNLKEAQSEREQKRNALYVLEHADRQIVGNYLFSYWRYLTHWSMDGWTKYDVDFLHRIIKILVQTY